MFGGVVMSKTKSHHVRKKQYYCFSEPIEKFLNLPGKLFVYWKDLHGVYIGANDYFSDLVKITTGNIPGILDYDITKYAFQAEQFCANDKKIISNTSTHMFIEYGDYVSGRKLTAMSFKTPLSNNLGNTLGVLGLSFPLTESNLADTTNIIGKLKITGLQPTLVLPTETISKQSLTKREKECLYWLVKGMTAKEIGKKLNLSYRTIEDHIDKIKSKFGCDTKSQLINMVFDCCLIL